MSCHENAKKRRFHGWTNPVLIIVPKACKYNCLALTTCYQCMTTKFHPIMETPPPRNPGAWVSIYAQLGIMPEQCLVLPRNAVRESDSTRGRSLYERLSMGRCISLGLHHPFLRVGQVFLAPLLLLHSMSLHRSLFPWEMRTECGARRSRLTIVTFGEGC
jgi:hypothetical protein